MVDLALKILLLVVPMYLANACAMLFGGKTPVDFNRKFLGKPLLGKGKTWKGAFSGIFLGALGALAIQLLFTEQAIVLANNYAVFGLFSASGAVLGDLAASFFKRRIGKKPGEPLLLIDQLDFVAGGLLLGGVLYLPSALEIGIIVVLTLLMHKLTNFIAFKVRIKRVPW